MRKLVCIFCLILIASSSLGQFMITNGAHVILDGESDVLLDKRVTVELGSSLEVR